MPSSMIRAASSAMKARPGCSPAIVDDFSGVAEGEQGLMPVDHAMKFAQSRMRAPVRVAITRTATCGSG